MPQAHHFHFAVFVAVGRQHAHEAVVAGHLVLQKHGVRVSRPVDGFQDGGGLGGGCGGIYLLHAVEWIFPVQNAAGRLHNNRVGKAQRPFAQRGGV